MGRGISSCCNPTKPIEQLTERVQTQLVDRPIKPRPRRKLNRPDSFYFQPLENNQEFEELIKKYKVNERKLKKALKVNITAMDENRLEEPYYLVQQRAFYVGEWAYNKLFHSDVPHGIGRLYESDFISEGEFELEPVLVADPEDLEKKEELDEESKQQLKELLKVSLNGRGRKFNKHELIDGEFVRGRLHGPTGIYENRKEGAEYYYEGNWVDGRRKGRGIETTKQYSYNGEFEDDEREGKGIYTHLLTPTLKRELEAEDKRVQQRLRQLDMREQSQKDRKSHFKESQKQIIDIFDDVLKENYKWMSPFSGDSLLDNPDFYRERLIRTAYLETYNGDFHRNKFHGYGMYVWNMGKVYRGEWKFGELDGVGQFLWPNNIVYRGQYSKDQRHGKGEMQWSEGLKWRGSWAYGMRHGYGEGIEIDFDMKSMRVTGSKWKRDKQIEICFHHKWQIVDFKAVKVNDKLELSSSESEAEASATQLRRQCIIALGQTLHMERTARLSKLQSKVGQLQQKRSVQPNVQNGSPTNVLSHRFEMSTQPPKSQRTTGASWMRVNFFDT